MLKVLKPILLLLLAAIVLPLALSNPSSADPDAEAWEDVREQLFEGKTVEDTKGDYKVYVDASVKDAALVPVSMRIPSAMVAKTRRIYLVIDNNPTPVAARFEFGDLYRNGGDIGERYIDTRVRVASHSHVRAVFETDDGRLIMAHGYAAGGGGCSSAPSKDIDNVLAQLGRIKVKLATQPNISDHWRQATVMVRHPNFTGMQPDEKNGGFLPSWYVDKIDVMHGGKILFRVEGGISLSSDPNIRFTFGSNNEDGLIVTAVDTKGTLFKGASRKEGS